MANKLIDPRFGSPVAHPAPVYPVGEHMWLELHTHSANGGATLEWRHGDSIQLESHELRRLYEVLKELFDGA